MLRVADDADDLLRDFGPFAGRVLELAPTPGSVSPRASVRNDDSCVRNWPSFALSTSVSNIAVVSCKRGDSERHYSGRSKPPTVRRGLPRGAPRRLWLGSSRRRARESSRQLAQCWPKKRPSGGAV